MKVVLRNPRREVDLAGPLRVGDVLERLDVNPETVIVIRDDTLITKDEEVSDHETIELRPVISGGAGGVWGGSSPALYPLSQRHGDRRAGSCGPPGSR